MKNYITNFDPFLEKYFFGGNRRKAPHMMKTDIKELKDSFELEVELPKVKKEDVKITLKNGYLTITATYNNEEQEDTKYLVRERRYGEFSRSYYVDEAVELKDVNAKLTDGVLTVTIKKIDEKEKEKESLVTIN